MLRRACSLGLAAAFALGALTFARPVQPVSAYNLIPNGAFPRGSAPNLVAAVWPQHYFDNSTWFKNALIGGFNAWNDAPTAVFVSMEFVEDSRAQLLYWTDTNSGDGSTGGCAGWNSDNTCAFSILQLAENSSDMRSDTPVYDQQTVAHEEGHGLGLDHSCVSGALMSGPAGPCQSQQYSCNGESNCVDTPQQDDINGVVRLYGAGSSGNSGGGCSSTRTPALPGGANVGAGPVIPPVQVPERNYIDSVNSSVGAAKANPVGTAVQGVAVAKAATGKVVPWSRVPTITVGGVTIQSPC